MSALLTKAFETWVAECTASNLPARPDAIIFALMEREPTHEDKTVPEEKITYVVNELTCGQLSQNTIVCSAVVPDDCAFSYDWICLIHQASGTLCGVIKTPVRQKTTGESLIRNFTITYSGIAQSAQITVPPQNWQVDITPELKTALKAPNHLSEIADEGKEAQQESRDNLGLKSAATMEPQIDIRDRTEGRLTIPGAFGFGHIFEAADVIRFSAESEFLSWAAQATPGEYSVNGPGKVIPGGVLFNGMISIRWMDASRDTSQPDAIAKAIIFYGINGDIYYNRYWPAGDGHLTGWEKLKLSETGIANTLSSTGGRANNYGYPGIGGVVFAAYCINDEDADGRLFRGSGVSGSRLAAISVTAPYSHNGLCTATPQIVIAPPSAYPMAGTFVALSGEPTTKVSAGTSITGLFVRIM